MGGGRSLLLLFFGIVLQELCEAACNYISDWNVLFSGVCVCVFVVEVKAQGMKYSLPDLVTAS